MLIKVAKIDKYRYFDNSIEYKYVFGSNQENFIDFQYSLFIVVEDPDELGEPLVKAINANIDVVIRPSILANAVEVDGVGVKTSTLHTFIKNHTDMYGIQRITNTTKKATWEDLILPPKSG